MVLPSSLWGTFTQQGAFHSWSKLAQHVSQLADLEEPAFIVRHAHLLTHMCLMIHAEQHRCVIHTKE